MPWLGPLHPSLTRVLLPVFTITYRADLVETAQTRNPANNPRLHGLGARPTRCLRIRPALFVYT